jgi:osmoprotectant transport system substrate-binding protein
MVTKLVSTVLLVTLLLVALTACSSTGSTPSPTKSPAAATSAASKGPITIGSKIDTEGGLLAQVIILLLNKNGFKTVDKSQLGPTQIVRQALLGGEIDIYPEYTGNGAFFFSKTDPTIWKDAQKGYAEVKQLDMAANNVVWLTPAPANNTWAIAIPQKLADSANIRDLAALADYVNKGGFIKLAGSEEFITSPVALPAFESAYGFTLKQDQLLSFSGGNTAQTEKAAADNTSGVNAAMAYGTDGSLSALNLIILADPKGVQPVYEPAPIVRGAVFTQYPEIGNILAPVFLTLDLVTLQTLNAKIALDGQAPADVARAYLTSKGFLP